MKDGYDLNCLNVSITRHSSAQAHSTTHREAELICCTAAAVFNPKKILTRQYKSIELSELMGSRGECHRFGQVKLSTTRKVSLTEF